jgi:error-prone DNA polymerase
MKGLVTLNLRARSAFSFLEGVSLPEDLAARAAELGYKAIAVADRDRAYVIGALHEVPVVVVYRIDHPA